MFAVPKEFASLMIIFAPLFSKRVCSMSKSWSSVPFWLPANGLLRPPYGSWG